MEPPIFTGRSIVVPYLLSKFLDILRGGEEKEVKKKKKENSGNIE